MNNNLFYIAPSDPDLQRAIQLAKTTIDQFVTALNHPKPMQDTFSIKIVDTENPEGEFVWVYPVKLEGEHFVGTIDVEDKARCREVKVSKNDVVDWFYVDNNWLKGGYTTRLIFDRTPEEGQYDLQQSLPFMIGPMQRDSLEHQLMDTIGHCDLEGTRSILKANSKLVKKSLQYVRVGATSKSINLLTPLHYAVEVSNIEIIEQLWKAGGDVNARDKFGNTCLWSAVCRGELRLVERLLEMGADPNLGDEARELTPIFSASARDSKEIVLLLIYSGTDMNHRLADSKTPMFYVQNAEIVDILYAAGVPLNCKDDSGNTALHWAISCGHKDVARRLVMLGAKLDIRDENGLTALDEAKKNEDLDADFILELEQIAASRKNASSK